MRERAKEWEGRVRRLALDIRQTKRFMALSCFPKISPKLIIIQASNGSRKEGGPGVPRTDGTRRTTAQERRWACVG